MDDQPPTQLARPIDGTEAQLAWSDAEPPEVVDYHPHRVRLAIGAALVLVAAAGGVAVWQVSGQSVTSPKVASKSTPELPPPTPPTSADRETPPAPRPSSAPVPTSRAPVVVESAALRKPPPPPEPTLDPPLWTVDHDVQFVQALQANGWSIWDPAAMANNAHYICTWLRNGDSPAQATMRLRDITRAEAWDITNKAMAIYPNCP